MRTRRPELYVDSTVEGAPKLTREVFEFHVATLTKGKQELAFEHLARQLCEKEIYPKRRFSVALLPAHCGCGGGEIGAHVLAHAVVHPVNEDYDAAFWRMLGRITPDYEDPRRRPRRVGARFEW